MKIKWALFTFLLVVNVFAQEGARYLIITHDNFRDAITPLAEWKTKKGVLAKIEIGE